jgi:hypothetical protein
VSKSVVKELKAGLCLVLPLVLLLGGCAANRAISVGDMQSIQPAHTTIALAPQGGLFADLIGIELAAQGYTIVDTGATLAILVFQHRAQENLLTPEVMATLRKQGIDALMVVEKADGADGLPQTVQVRLLSTVSMTEIGGVDWENGWFRRGVLESAQEIAAALI